LAGEWNMPRRGESCVGCGRLFEIGESLQAILYEVSGGYQRKDFCERCPPPAEPVPLAVWKTRRPAPATPKSQPFDREAVYAFFQRLEADERPEHQQFRFVLALLLWRKRVLKFRETERRDDTEYWNFSAPHVGRMHTAARPDLAEDELERLSAQLEQLLTGQAADVTLAESATAEEHGDGA